MMLQFLLWVANLFLVLDFCLRSPPRSKNAHLTSSMPCPLSLKSTSLIQFQLQCYDTLLNDRFTAMIEERGTAPQIYQPTHLNQNKEMSIKDNMVTVVEFHSLIHIYKQFGPHKFHFCIGCNSEAVLKLPLDKST